MTPQRRLASVSPDPEPSLTAPEATAAAKREWSAAYAACREAYRADLLSLFVGAANRNIRLFDVRRARDVARAQVERHQRVVDALDRCIAALERWDRRPEVGQ